MSVYLVDTTFHDHNKFNDPVKIGSIGTCSNDPGDNGANEPGAPIIVDNPFEDTLSVQNLLTGQDPNNQLDLNQFAVSTLNSILDLNNDTQNITATPTLTTIINNLLTDDLKVNNVFNQTGTTFIDFTDNTDININCTDLTWNGNTILTTDSNVGMGDRLTQNLNLGGFDITGVGFGGLTTLNGIDRRVSALNPIIIANEKKTYNIASVVNNVETKFGGQLICTGKLIADGGINVSGVSSDISGNLVLSDGKLTMLNNLIDMNRNNITNIGQYNINLSDSVFDTETNLSNTQATLEDIKSQTQNIQAFPDITFITGGLSLKNLYLQGENPAIKFGSDWEMGERNGELQINHFAGGSIIIGRRKETESESTIISHVDYSNMLPANMRSDISFIDGGINRCWGHTATYTAGVDILAGRILSLQDQNVGSDSTQLLKVEYLRNDAEVSPTVCPIGISLFNCLAGQKIDVCILGYTTVVTDNADASPERGSQVMADPNNLGKVRINVNGGGNEARIGFVAQSNPVANNGTLLIYYCGYYQPF